MKRSILVLFWVFMSATMFAQGGIDVAGIVLDEQGQELIGVSVQIKGKQGVGVVTDFDGRFKMTGVPAGSTLVFSYICLLYTSPSPRDRSLSRMPSSA